MYGPLQDSQLSITGFPIAWRVEIVDGDKHNGFEYTWLESDATRYIGTIC